MLLFVLAYLLFGLGGSRFVRNKVGRGAVGWDHEKHATYCDRYKSEKRECENYISCSPFLNGGGWKTIMILLTPILWPLYFLGWFMLAEKLPQLPHKMTPDERFQHQLANDPVFREIYESLNKQYSIGA